MREVRRLPDDARFVKMVESGRKPLSPHEPYCLSLYRSDKGYHYLVHIINAEVVSIKKLRRSEALDLLKG